MISAHEARLKVQQVQAQKSIESLARQINEQKHHQARKDKAINEILPNLINAIENEIKHYSSLGQTRMFVRMNEETEGEYLWEEVEKIFQDLGYEVSTRIFRSVSDVNSEEMFGVGSQHNGPKEYTITIDWESPLMMDVIPRFSVNR